MAKNTVEIETDLLIKQGEVLGEEKLSQMLARAALAIKVPEIVVRPKIHMKLSPGEIRNAIKEYQANVDAIMQGGVDKQGKALSNLVKTQLATSKSAYNSLNSLAGRQMTHTKFQGQEFQKTFKAFQQGFITDAKGVEHAVSTRTLKKLRSIKEFGEADKSLFSKERVNGVRQYNEELGQMAKLARQADTAIGKTTGGTKTNKYANVQPSYLAAEARQMEETVAATRGRLKSEAELRDEDEKRASAKEAKAERNRKKEADRAKTADEKARIARRKSNKEYRADLADRGAGNKALAKIRKGATVGLHETTDAAKELKARMTEANKQSRELSSQDPKKFANRIERLKRTVQLLKRELTGVNTLASKIGGKPSKAGPILERAGLSNAEQGKRRFLRNEIQAGRRAFLGSGGFGGSFAASHKQLDALAAFHRSKVAQARRIMSKLDQDTQKGRDSYDRLSKTMFRHGRDLEATTQRMRTFGGVTQQTSALFRQFFRYALGYGALYQVLAAVRSLISGLVDLDKALKGIQAVTQATNEEMVTIESGIKAVALETQFDAREIAQAAQILGQAGVIPKELPSALRATALFASATGSAIQISADLVTSMRNVFDTIGDQTIANQLTQAINISKLTAKDLKTVVSLSGQIAKSYQLTSEQYFAAATTLRNAGIKPSTVATGLRQGLIEIFSPDNKTIKALQERYSQLGEALSTAQVRDKFFGFSLTDSPLISALRELQRLGFTGEGKKVFQRAYDVRAENAISALINNITELEAASAKLTFGEAAVRAAETQMESLANSVSNTQAAISVLAHDLAGPMIGGLESMADAVTKGVQALTDMNLQMEILKGHGIGQALGFGAVGALLGGSKFKGGIVGKTAAAGLTGYAATKLSSSVSSSVDATAGEESEGFIKTLFKKIGEIFKASLGVLVPLLAIEILNVIRGAGSPAIAGVFKRVFSRKKGATGGGTGTRRGPGARYGAASAVTAVSTFFGSGIFKKIFQIATKATKFIRFSHIGIAITAFLAIVSGITSYLDSVRKSDVKGRLKKATKGVRRAQQRSRKLKDSQAEFTLSKDGKDAAPGTTAASVEKLEEDISAYETSLSHYFGRNSEDINGLTNKLADLGNQFPESGVEGRAGSLDAIKNALDTSLIRQDTTDLVVSQLSNQANSFIARAEALRTSTAQYLKNIQQDFAEKGEAIDKGSLAFLKAFEGVTGGALDKQALLFGLETGDQPVERAKAIVELTRKILTSQQEIFATTAEATEAREGELAAMALEAELAIEAIRTSDSVEQMFKVINDYTDQYFGLSDTGALGFKQQIKIMEEAQAQIQGEIKFQELLLNRIAEIDAEIQSRVKGGGQRGVGEKSNYELEEEKEKLQGVLRPRTPIDIVRGRGEASDAARQVQQEKLDAVRRTKRESSEKEIAKFARVLKGIVKDFSPGAKGEGRAALENLYPLGTAEEPGEKRALFDKLLEIAKDPKQLAELLSIDIEGETDIPDEYRKLFDEIFRLRQNLAKKNADFQGSFTPTLEENRAIRDAESAAKNAKKAKTFEFLTTEDEGKNLYKILQKLRVDLLTREINHLKKQKPLTDEDKDKRDKRVNALERKQDDEINKADDAIFAARIDAAKANLKAYKSRNSRILTGYKTQLARAIDSGDIKEAQRLDQLILGIKEQILALEIIRLRALEEAAVATLKAAKQPEEVQEAERARHRIARQNFIDDARADQVPSMTKPATARTIGSRVSARLAREYPIEPRLSEDDEEHGRLKQQGIVSSAEQRIAAKGDRIIATLAEIQAIEEVIDKQIALIGVLPEGEGKAAGLEALEIYRREVERLEEQIGSLKGAMVDDSGISAFGQQMDQGFNLTNVANKLDNSEDSIKNLGDTLQHDMVKGLDDVAGGFAEALVEGENFTEGMKEGFSRMLKQMAADILKAGILKLFSTILGVPSGFFGKAKGGVVEAKAAGGLVGGGTIKGAGTGTSDSIPGVVVDSSGRKKRGIRVSDGEGILTAKAVGGLGEGVFNGLNVANDKMLKTARMALSSVGFKSGGIPSGMGSLVAAGAMRGSAARPMGFAGGGIIKDSGKTTSGTSARGNSTVEHNFNASLVVEAEEGSGVDMDDLRRMDEGLNLRLREYVEEQLRPGGILQAARR
jgi:TP901 family phage tail tape measure protein